MKLKSIVKNYYYLVVGILCVLFAYTHASNGETTVLPFFEMVGENGNTKTIFYYVWHIITTENLVFGIVLLTMAFYRNLSKVRFTALTIAIIMIVRWAVIFFFTIQSDSDSVSQIIPDTIAIFIIVILLLLGTRVKNKVERV